MFKEFQANLEVSFGRFLPFLVIISSSFHPYLHSESQRMTFPDLRNCGEGHAFLKKNRSATVQVPILSLHLHSELCVHKGSIPNHIMISMSGP